MLMLASGAMDGPGDSSKRAAAEAALAYLPEAGIVGLGTGSTARFFIEGVGQLVKAGRKLVGVPTSQESRAQANALGIPLLGDQGPWQIDVTVDGADEVSDQLDLIKGGGCAHTREKIVNFSSRMNVIVVDESKLSRRLGQRWPIPIEVLAFGALATAERLGHFGPVHRREQGGVPRMTDAGNFVYDLTVGELDDPQALDDALHALPGVVETGLFCGRADAVVVASPRGISTLTRTRNS